MKILGIISEDFVNYKKPSLTIQMPYCSFKCDKDCGSQECQNWVLQFQDPIEIETDDLIDLYLPNDITEAVVFQGLEPFDSWEELFDFIQRFRRKCNDDVVIYTGYTAKEIGDKIRLLQNEEWEGNIIIKVGRYVPGQNPHKDEFLGVNLASDNQYSFIL